MGRLIAIKDFELPPSCYNCNFCMRRRTSDYGYFGMCDLTNEEGINLYEHSRSEDCPLVEAIPKDQYETRLKADMVAMLTELQLEIEGLRVKRRDQMDAGFNIGIIECSNLTQKKIDALKGEGEK